MGASQRRLCADWVVLISGAVGLAACGGSTDTNAESAGADTSGSMDGSGSSGLTGSTAGTSTLGSSESDAGGSDGATTGATTGTDAPFDPNPVLVDLPDNTALDLGRYTCADRMPQISEHCEKITDYSRFNYDPYQHRIVMFGGGHSASGRTDIDALDLETLSWASVYPSMSCDDVAAEDLDPRGFHRGTGHPVARHTYDMNVVADLGGQGWLLMLSTEGFAGHCHSYNATIRSVAGYPLDGIAASQWHYSPEFSLPWSYAAAAEFDPTSGMVVVIGSARGAGEGGMWVYDPNADEVVTFVDPVRYAGIDANLVYYPPSDTMFLFTRGDTEPHGVFEIVLDRTDWSKTESAQRSPEGVGPITGTTGFAFDARTEIIGGGVVGGMFHIYDPAADVWSAESPTIQSGEGAVLDKVIFHMLDYDPINNVYWMIASGPDKRTWAYRYRQ